MQSGLAMSYVVNGVRAFYDTGFAHIISDSPLALSPFDLAAALGSDHTCGLTRAKFKKQSPSYQPLCMRSGDGFK